MDLNKLKGQLQTEVDTAFLYDSIAEIQTDENLNRVLRGLSDIEGHAQHMLDKVRTIQSEYKMPAPSELIPTKIRQTVWLRIYNQQFVKYRKQFAVNSIKNKIEKDTGFEHNHLNIIEAVNNNAALSLEVFFLNLKVAINQ
jgi:hypothetical protein